MRNQRKNNDNFEESLLKLVRPVHLTFDWSPCRSVSGLHKVYRQA